jgi:outer membrane protein OmpA-like peptidoglycan-associated protein
MKDNPSVSIEIGGHTDDIGDEKSNIELSESRARTVYEYLIGNQINSKSITYKGYGEELPISNNTTEDSRKNNRRIEFKITNK